MVTYRFLASLTSQTRVPVFDAMQGDALTRAAAATLMENGAPWEVPEGLTASVAYTGPGENKGWYDTMPDGSAACTICGNTVTAAIVPAMLGAAGVVTAAIVLMDAAGRQISTFPFRINVIRRTGAEDLVNQYYAVSTLAQLNDALDDVQRRLRELEEAGGVDVSGAAVGQIIRVAAVDDAGKPTAWTAEDMPDVPQNVVQYSAQTLGEGQQMQARRNLGLYYSGNVPTVLLEGYTFEEFPGAIPDTWEGDTVSVSITNDSTGETLTWTDTVYRYYSYPKDEYYTFIGNSDLITERIGKYYAADGNTELPFAIIGIDGRIYTLVANDIPFPAKGMIIKVENLDTLEYKVDPIPGEYLPASDPAGTAAEKVAEHDSDETAHADIREEIRWLSDDSEQIAMLAEADMLPAVYDASGAILTDQNGNVVLRY